MDVSPRSIASRFAPWRKQQVSSAQLSFLKKLGIHSLFDEDKDFSASSLDNLTRGEAELVICLLQFGRGKRMRSALAARRRADRERCVALRNDSSPVGTGRLPRDTKG